MQQLLSNLMVMMDQFMNNRIMFTRIYVNLRLQSFYFSPINYCLWNTWKLMNIVEFKFLWILFSINPIDTKNSPKMYRFFSSFFLQKTHNWLSMN